MLTLTKRPDNAVVLEIRDELAADIKTEPLMLDTVVLTAEKNIHFINLY